MVEMLLYRAGGDDEAPAALGPVVRGARRAHRDGRLARGVRCASGRGCDEDEGNLQEGEGRIRRQPEEPGGGDIGARPRPAHGDQSCF